MKIVVGRRKEAGFSLVELMTVIGIMILLAGILMASLPGIQTKVNRNRVEAFLAELQAGLESYELDHGIFPQNPIAADRDEAGFEGAKVLYKYLSGDWNLDGEVDVDSNEKVYVKRLSYDENKDSKDPRSTSIGGDFMVVDSYGNPVRYIALPPNIDRKSLPDARKTRNPSYDIWSIADADPDDPDEQAKWITNWQSQ